MSPPIAYFQEIDTPANQTFLKLLHSEVRRTTDVTEVATMTYHGMELWAAAVKKAGTSIA